MRNTMRPARRKGFTLIELLIVVAIIAILASIAVPNFLEALTRARVSRVKADMRTIATALDAYFFDNNSYPRDHDNAGWEGKFRWSVWDGQRGPNQVGLYYLTTPVSYLTGMAADPFSPEGRGSDKDANWKFASMYVLASGSDNEECFGKSKEHAYMLISFGPDKKDQSDDEDYWPSKGERVVMGNYDPTNGAKSAGDIYRFGGGYRVGDWRIWDQPWDKWSVQPTLP